jgi:hypothetical protein
MATGMLALPLPAPPADAALVELLLLEAALFADPFEEQDRKRSTICSTVTSRLFRITKPLELVLYQLSK